MVKIYPCSSQRKSSIRTKYNINIVSAISQRVMDKQGWMWECDEAVTLSGILDRSNRTNSVEPNLEALNRRMMSWRVAATTKYSCFRRSSFPSKNWTTNTSCYDHIIFSFIKKYIAAYINEHPYTMLTNLLWILQLLILSESEKNNHVLEI